MAKASGSGGLGALTLGGIAGTAVVLGGVVLFQLGVFGTGQPDSGTANGGQAGSQSAAGSEEFAGDGEESGQPLQNNGISQSAEPESGAETASEAPAAEETAAAAPEDQAAADAPATAAAVTGAAQDGAVGGDDAAEQIALAEPAAEAAAAPQPAPQEPASKEDIFVLEAPELDLVRVDREGAAVIAGRAQEGVRVSVLLDGEVLEQLDVPAGGEFVSLTTIAPSADARVVTLLAEHGGQQSASGASFILAPVSPVAAAPQEDTAGTAAAGAAEEPAQAEAQVAVLAPGTQAETEQPAAAAGQDDPGAAVTPGAEAAEPVAETAESTETAPAPADPVLAGEPAAPQPQGQSVAVLRADQDGVEVVQPAVPADPELSAEVALDSISYNGTGGVDLAGRARPKSRVRVYVDNVPVTEIDTAGDGRWNGRLEGLEPGIYTLRLDEIEAVSGAVVSRLETPFKREAPESLPQPGGDATPDRPAPLVRAVTVQKGDTLWAISREKYGSGFLYVRVFEANRGAIRDPDLIYPGQVFTIPE